MSFGPMPKLTVITTNFAKAPLIIGALLLFLATASIRFLRMPVDTLSVLLVTVTILFEKLAYWYLIWIIHMQILAIISFLANILEPVNAHLLL